MADYTVFYSWQSDSPANCNRRFIREAINAAAESIAASIEVADSPRVESGMEGVPGSPEVASVMFEKIADSAIFIGDVTLVGTIQSAQKKDVVKKTMNPNVALEMGFAAGLLGWGRVICIINEHYGKREEQPFDVRNRRYPIDYSLSPEAAADKAKNDAANNALSVWITKAIGEVETHDLSTVDRALKLLDIRCLELIGMFKDHHSFPEPELKPRLLMDLEKFNTAAVRLLELGILKSDINPKEKMYSYQWTYLGKKVLGKLGF